MLLFGYICARKLLRDRVQPCGLGGSSLSQRHDGRELWSGFAHRESPSLLRSVRFDRSVTTVVSKHVSPSS